MSEPNSRPTLRGLIDNLSDTKSWDDLANELEKYAAKIGDGARNRGETIEMKDLLSSLDEGDESDDSPPDANGAK